jgi:hypothetical protein
LSVDEKLTCSEIISLRSTVVGNEEAAVRSGYNAFVRIKIGVFLNGRLSERDALGCVAVPNKIVGIGRVFDDKR